MAMQQIHQWLLKIFGSRNERMVRSYMRVAQAAGALEASIQALSDEQLKAKTAEFKQRLAGGQKPHDILPEAFAVVREAARRTLNMRHFDVQLVGGNVLYDAKIAEMATGEGKTLVATLAAYLAHLAGRKVHIVTVNDYLAKRDAEWMGPVYRALGLTVGAIQADMDTIGQIRRQQYECDITYGTNNEFGFDYLRDNMKISVEQMVQGPLDYAIIDEVDSILIDEARTPLIISGPAQDDISRYKKADAIARHLMSLQSTYDRLKKQIDQLQRDIANAQGELAEAKRAKDDARIQKAQKAIDQMNAQLADAQRRLAAELQGTEDQIEENTLYYNVDYERRSVHLMEKGIAAAQAFAGIGSFYLGQNTEWPHLIEQALRAHLVFEKEKHYVVMDGKVIIVDEFTGRLMHGRQWSDGLHQAVEAKEGVPIKEETQTLATITLQNFFKLYNRIAGMTGTAATEAEEFMKIYNLDVVTVPPNKPCIRIDKDDLIYKTMREKFNAIVEEIHTVCTSGRPVLVGTVSIEKSEALSEALKRRYGIEHEVLNAKQHAREALIVEKAGQQHTARDGSIRGNVTIATNMAGRGTDIKLGPGVAAIGGLHIVGTERHEARRIDNQLRGRAGRQGDPGSSVFFLSFDDDLLRIFAPDWTVKALTLIGWQEGEPIQHRRISKGIEKAQKKVEQRNFEIRKSLLEYDEVMDYQRKIFYARRRKVIEGKDLKQTIWQMIEHTVQTTADKMLSEDYPYQSICEWAATEFGVELDVKRIRGMDGERIADQIRQQAKKNIANQIPLALGEYLEDYEDKSTWSVDALCRWAMSAFSVHLTANKVRQMTAEQIETELIEAACQQVDKKPMTALEQFLKPDFRATMFSRWAAGKFDLKLDPAQLMTQSPAEVVQAVLTELDQKYTAREIEYPVEFAMNIVLSQPTPTVYAFQTLADWARRRYECDLTAEQIAASSPKDIHQKLIELSRQWHTERLEKTVNEKVAQLSPAALAEWANQRFEAHLTAEQLTNPQQAADLLMDVGRQFLRRELAELERFVLTQIYDQVWKDHLYAMDHLKESIMLRAYAERDPKIEYKHEGFKMFQQMLETIEDRVTDIIFRVRLAVGVQQRSVYRAAQTQKQDVSQFETAQRQRAAAMAPQGETVTKPIKLEKPKVGRNDPCPCGSGKKYKKCCAGKE